MSKNALKLTYKIPKFSKGDSPGLPLKRGRSRRRRERERGKRGAGCVMDS